MENQGYSIRKILKWSKEFEHSISPTHKNISFYYLKSIHFFFSFYLISFFWLILKLVIKILWPSKRFYSNITIFLICYFINMVIVFLHQRYTPNTYDTYNRNSNSLWRWSLTDFAKFIVCWWRPNFNKNKKWENTK